MTEQGGHALFRWLREMRDQHPVWLDQMGLWNGFRSIRWMYLVQPSAPSRMPLATSP
jgi:hypothetical protein